MKSKGMSLESIKNPYTSEITFSSELIYMFNQFGRLEFIGGCLKQDSVSFLHKKVVISYVSYKLDTWSKDLGKYFTLGNCLFGAVICWSR